MLEAVAEPKRRPLEPRPDLTPLPERLEHAQASLCLFQSLWQISYRETLETASKDGFLGPSLSTYHYRVQKFPLSCTARIALEISLCVL